MTADWSFCRLFGPTSADALFSLVPDLVGLVRAEDPHALWSFRRLPDSLVLRFRSSADIGRLAREMDDRRLWTVRTGRYEPQTTKYLNLPETKLADELASTSSDFALTALRDGRPGLTAAVWHLRRLVELIPEPDRASFLFHCRQHWVSPLTPARRVELTTAAEVSLEPFDAPEAWQQHLDAVRQIVTTAGGMPTRFLLFDHAQITHNQLGVDNAGAALAARVVRSTAGRSLVPRPRSDQWRP
ncbi:MULTISPECIES: hypothetical protein [unclassified Streptomyces]|uniref:hypothetical protein n=1 Tax=unclassified Streptomyces TaxID=2593676 RepID=UPI0033F3B85A